MIQEISLTQRPLNINFTLQIGKLILDLTLPRSVPPYLAKSNRLNLARSILVPGTGALDDVDVAAATATDDDEDDRVDEWPTDRSLPPSDSGGGRLQWTKARGGGE